MSFVPHTAEYIQLRHTVQSLLEANSVAMLISPFVFHNVVFLEDLVLNHMDESIIVVP